MDEGTKDEDETSVKLGADEHRLKASVSHQNSNSSTQAYVTRVGEGNNDGGIVKEDDDEFEDEYDDYEDYEEYDYDEDEDSDDSNAYFIADRPFLFVVMDKEHNLVLLMGRVTNPLP